MNKKEKLYKFILRLALTFRLSLKNVCIIQGMEGTLEEQKKVYEELDRLFCSDLVIKNAYDYLFNFETINESDKLSNRALGITNMFLFKYKNALKTGSKEEIVRLNSELEKIDRDFKDLKQKLSDFSVSDEQAVIISKYRLKYAISRQQICKILEISSKSLLLREEKLSNEVLKQKLKLLSDFYQDIFKIKGNIR